MADMVVNGMAAANPYVAAAQGAGDLVLGGLQLVESYKDKKRQERRQRVLDEQARRESAINLGLIRDQQDMDRMSQSAQLSQLASSYLQNKNSGLR